MASKLTKPVTRTVQTVDGRSLVVTLTVDGIVLRESRKRDSYLLPYAHALTRAQVIANDGVGVATGKPARKRSRTVSRGLLTTG